MVGFKIVVSYIEVDIDFVLEVGVDYIIFDGCGGGMGFVFIILCDNINVFMILVLVCVCCYFDKCGVDDVILVIIGGLWVVEDFVKVMMLGVDVVVVVNFVF